MNINLFVENEPNLRDYSEIVNCLEYCLELSPILGNLVINKEIELDIDKAFFNNFNAKKEEVIRFNNLVNNSENIHIIVANRRNFNGRLTGLTVANLALVNLAAQPIAHPLIHEFGHAMGLVQPGAPNYFKDSRELSGGDPAHHSFGPFCIMSVRNIEPELQPVRYASYVSNPQDVFCKDCTGHLQTVKLEELPWYNQVKS